MRGSPGDRQEGALDAREAEGDVDTVGVDLGDDGIGLAITAPSAVASTVTVVPGVVCCHRPGPSVHAVPSEGWPAKGISYVGVKIRIEYAPLPVTVGNVVSLRFTSRCDRLHARLGAGLEHDARRVARERAIGEDVDGAVAHQPSSVACTSASDTNGSYATSASSHHSARP